MRIALLVPELGGSVMIDLERIPETEKKIMIGRDDIKSPRLKLVLRALKLRNSNFYNLLLEQENGVRYDKETDENIPAFSGKIGEIDSKEM